MPHGDSASSYEHKRQFSEFHKASCMLETSVSWMEHTVLHGQLQHQKYY